MAYIHARKNKDKQIISYNIRVSRGYDPDTHKQLRPYTMTWHVPAGWSEKRAEREAMRQATLFEQQCAEGIVGDRNVTFEEYSVYFCRLKEKTNQIKPSTLYSYQNRLIVINDKLGSVKLSELRPQHLNRFYTELASCTSKRKKRMAFCKVELSDLLSKHGFCPGSFCRYTQQLSPDRTKAVFSRSLDILAAHRAVQDFTAYNIAAALGEDPNDIFTFIEKANAYDANYIISHHRLIATILEQAVREQLIPTNPARLAVLPKHVSQMPNFFQPDTISNILQALTSEPIMWRVMIHLFIVTGCRRGEILGMKWNKLDWNTSQILIDNTVSYTPGRGIYESTPKTVSSVRHIKLPNETMALLREYHDYQQNTLQYASFEKTEPKFIFANDEGGPIFPAHVNDWLTAFSERHKLPHINPHAFRHTQASILCFNGVDIVSISRRLGHSNVSTTSNIYSHVMKAAEERMSDCIADVLLKCTTKKKSSRQG